MKRRDFIAYASGAVVMKPFFARARERPARIGILNATPRDAPPLQAFFAQLADHRYVESKNLTVLLSIVNQRGAPSPKALIEQQVELIVIGAPDSIVRATMDATRTIPIVLIALNYDPLARGFVASLAHPGGNVTGVYARAVDLVPKRVELLREMVPGANRLGVLWDAEAGDEFVVAEDVAKSSGLDVRAIELRDPPYDFDRAFERLAQLSPQILLVISSLHFLKDTNHIAALALRYRIPAMFKFSLWAEAGGLMSLGASREGAYRRAADLVARILDGDKPVNLPVERADRFELVLNLQTAKALGLTVPQSLLARADRVIE
jgi:putative ABC transport system substrate-binding protein